jgi:predicted nucleotidyltransferase
MSQQNAVQDALTEYSAALQAYCPGQIERLILFGSQTTGDATAESDIDVLVVVKWETKQLPGGFYRAPFSDPRWKTIVNIAADIGLDYGVYISPLVVSKRRFQRWSPLFERIKKEGIELWPRNKN